MSRSTIVDIWERIRFKGEEPLSWDRSFDAGRTWTRVPWGGSQLPFTRLNYVGLDAQELEEFIVVRQYERKVNEPKYNQYVQAV